MKKPSLWITIHDVAVRLQEKKNEQKSPKKPPAQLSSAHPANISYRQTRTESLSFSSRRPYLENLDLSLVVRYPAPVPARSQTLAPPIPSPRRLDVAQRAVPPTAMPVDYLYLLGDLHFFDDVFLSLQLISLVVRPHVPDQRSHIAAHGFGVLGL